VTRRYYAASFPRETDEFLLITVTVDGVAVVDNVEFSTVIYGLRPETWAVAATLDGDIGIDVVDYEVGEYEVFARVTTVDEMPVMSCGLFEVT